MLLSSTRLAETSRPCPSPSRASGEAPEVSIGIPVYNAERFLGAALDSLLGQSFQDFEIIVADNASTDGTPALCHAYMERDSRIRYVRHPRNLGAGRNWNFVVHQARGRYFKWASANDVCHKDMLSACVEVLRHERDVVLCYGRTLLIDDDGASLGEYPYDLSVTGERPRDRFRLVHNELRLNNAQSGLIRLDLLRKTRLDRLYPSGDRVLMAELALLGKFRLLPQVLLYRRMGRQSATRFLSDAELATFIDPEGSKQFLAWRSHLDYFTSVLRLPVPWAERISALEYTLRAAYWDRHNLWKELCNAVRRSLPEQK